MPMGEVLLKCGAVWYAVPNRQFSCTIKQSSEASAERCVMRRLNLAITAECCWTEDNMGRFAHSVTVESKCDATWGAIEARAAPLKMQRSCSTAGICSWIYLTKAH